MPTGTSARLPNPDQAWQRTIEAQSLANQQATQANRPNMFTPYGSSTWKQISPNQWDNTVKLSAPMQNILFNQNQTQMGMAKAAKGLLPQIRAATTPIDVNRLQPWQAVPVADQTTRQRVEDAYFARERAQMDPMYQQQEDRLRTRLAQQGLAPTSEAFSTDMGNFLRSKNSAYANALNDAIIQGGSQMQQQFNMGLQSAEHNNNLRNAQLQQLAFFKGFPLQQASSLLQGGGGVQMPQFQNFSQQATTQVPDLFQDQMAAYNAQVQADAASNAMIGQYLGMGLGGLLGGAKLYNSWGK